MSSVFSGTERVALVCAGLWIAGCGAVERPPSEIIPLRVEYAGCRTVFGDDVTAPVCLLEINRQLRLWIQAPTGAEIELWAGEIPLDVASEDVNGGQLYRVSVPPAATELSVRTRGSADGANWTLPLSNQTTPEWLEDARSLLKNGDFDAASQAVAPHLDSVDAFERGTALGILSRVARQDGAGARAVELLIESIALYHAAGRWMDVIRDTTVLVFDDIQRRRFVEARARLDELPLPPGSPAEAHIWIAYYRGLLAARVGDFRSALVDLETAAGLAERVSMPLEQSFAEQILGRVLQNLGRSSDAAELYRRLREDPADHDPGRWADLLTNQAWSLLLAREAGEDTNDPTPLLEQALDTYESSNRCGQQVNVWINLALAHLQNNQASSARSAVAAARELYCETTELSRLWWLEVEGRIALSDHRPGEALALYSRLAGLAADAFSPDSRWRAILGRARAHDAAGDRAAALADLERAEALLDEESLQVPLHEGRETFVAQRETGTRFYLDLLLRDGRDAEALNVARRSRARVLRSLRSGDRLAQLGPEERDQWYRTIGEYLTLRDSIEEFGPALPTDELIRRQQQQARQNRAAQRALDQAFVILGGDKDATLPALRSGELTLAYHPLPQGWIAFAADDESIETHRFDLPDEVFSHPEELASRLLKPFRQKIERSERLRLLPYGPLREIDLHALPFGDDILLSGRPVVYALDLEAPKSTVSEPPLRALIVADPRDDLPAARYEAGIVEETLRSFPEIWTLETLHGSAADVESIQRLLPTVDLLHYAGHGVFAGRGGWESALPLAGSGRLRLGDLLALEATPWWVVLSGCETARSAIASPAESIGLAHAFLLTGTHQVIAAVRPLGDRDAANVSTALYRLWDTAPDLAILLQQAILRERQRRPNSDWASFRVLEP